MTEELFNKVVALVIDGRIPLSNTCGIYNDIENSFVNNTELIQCSVRYVNNPVCLCVLSGKVSNDKASLRDICEILHAMYNRIVYSNFHACTLNLYESHVSVRFITVPASDKTFFTGQINITRTNFESLVKSRMQYSESKIEQLPEFQ